MPTQEFLLARAVLNRPHNNWTPQEESHVYWWFYTEMESPSEEQIKYFIRRTLLVANAGKWCKLLLQLFPTEENMRYVLSIFPTNIVKIHKIIRGILKASPLSDAHINLALKYGSRRTRSKASRKSSLVQVH